MAHVVVLDSVTEDIFICGLCKLVFNSLHLFVHKNLLCRKEATNLGNLGTAFLDNSESVPQLQSYRNNNLHTGIPPNTTVSNILCTICNKIFKSRKCLHAHIKSHERLSQCPICGRCFENNSHLKRHILTHKVWPYGLNETTAKTVEADLLSYTCSYCNCTVSNYSQFRAHLNNHISFKKYKCIQNECTYFFETLDNLLHHIAAAHDNPKYTCHVCKDVFNSLKDIAIHRDSHNDKETLKDNQTHQFKCSLCDATFRKREKLSLHMLTENHSKACIHCNKIFASDKRLRMHLHIHKKSKPYLCTICDSSFLMKKYLIAHLLKHGESKFTCDVCKQTFKRQDVLRRHMKIHFLRKTFKCPFQDITHCNKEFTRSDKLKDHIRSHTRTIKPSGKSSKYSEKEMHTLEICIVPLDMNDIDKV